MMPLFGSGEIWSGDGVMIICVLVRLIDSCYFIKLLQHMSSELRQIAEAMANEPFFSLHANTVKIMLTMSSSIITMAMNVCWEALLEPVVLFILVHVYLLG